MDWTLWSGKQIIHKNFWGAGKKSENNNMTHNENPKRCKPYTSTTKKGQPTCSETCSSNKHGPWAVALLELSQNEGGATTWGCLHTLIEFNAMNQRNIRPHFLVIKLCHRFTGCKSRNWSCIATFFELERCRNSDISGTVMIFGKSRPTFIPNTHNNSSYGIHHCKA